MKSVHLVRFFPQCLQFLPHAVQSLHIRSLFTINVQKSSKQTAFNMCISSSLMLLYFILVVVPFLLAPLQFLQ